MMSSIILDWNLPLTWLSPLFALGAVFTGFVSILAPKTAVKLYGLSTGEEGLRFIPIFGARNLAIGVSALGLLVYGWRQPLGFLLGAAAIPGVVDAVITYRHGTRVAFWVHVIGTVVLVAYSAWLLY
ncbi:MAG: DUF4267 domain-containing protein [Proteobacteria bacterium]|nr:MAG: DUF4267 domain-containing protein [Pseudomonadota bacterium]